MQPLVRTAFVLCFLILALVTSAHNHEMKKGFAHVSLTDQLENPTCLAVANDGRVFITQKNGTILVFQDGELLPEPFISFRVDEHGERGLGSITLDPDFDNNGYIYVYYTIYNTNVNRLSRFTAIGNKAVPGSEKILMEFDEMSGTFHNAGVIRFANDGTMFITVGDGVSGSNSQNLTTRLGKIIRLHKDGSIPANNPMYSELEGDNRAIYAYGLRNPFSGDYNPNTSMFLVNEVGLSDWEEINEIEPGKNYGWPLIEGFITEEDRPDHYKDPLYAYPHGNNIGCAVVGGAFYIPTKVTFPPEYIGKYFFSDYCTGIISTLDPSTGTVLDTIMKGAEFLSSMVCTDWGDLYYLSFKTGELNKISYIGDGSPFIASQPESVLAVVNENAEFEVEAYGDDLAYQWYKNGALLSGETNAKLELSQVELADSGVLFFCELSNTKGALFTDSAELLVTSNQRPVITINLPTKGSFYEMGTRLKFEGSATDPEDGPISTAQLQWTVDFHHNVHTHPGLPKTSGIDTGSLFIARKGETDTNVWYRVHLKAIDKQGLSKEEFVDVHPKVQDVIATTSPLGLKLSIDGTEGVRKFAKPAVVGNVRVLTASPTQLRNDSLYEFVKWENGFTENNRTIIVGEKTKYHAEYRFKELYAEGHGDGLLGRYYDNIHFEEPFVKEQVDPIIDFFWNWSSPLGYPYGKDSISIKWSGSLLAPISDWYAFTADFDDVCSLRIANATVIDRLDWAGNRIVTNSVYLKRGERYNIDIWYKQYRYSSRMKLHWAFGEQEIDIIPQNYLYSERAQDSGYIDDRSEFFMYPNPATSQITFRFMSTNESVVAIDIYSAKGERMLSLNDEVNLNDHQLDISGFAMGMYIVQARTNSNSFTRRFLKID